LAKAGDDHDPVFEAQEAAQKACGTLVEILRKHLDALESGTMKQGEQETAMEETGDMFKTVKRMVQEVPCTSKLTHFPKPLLSTLEAGNLQRAWCHGGLAPLPLSS